MLLSPWISDAFMCRRPKAEGRRRPKRSEATTIRLGRLADHAEAEAQRGRDTVHGRLGVEQRGRCHTYEKISEQ